MELELPGSSDQSRNHCLALGISKPEGMVVVAGRWAGGRQKQQMGVPETPLLVLGAAQPPDSEIRKLSEGIGKTNPGF